MQRQAALVLPALLMHQVKLSRFRLPSCCYLLVMVLSSRTCLQMHFIALLQGLGRYLTRPQHTHKCGWAQPWLPPLVRCGLVQQWRHHMLRCALVQHWHLEQQGWVQPPPVQEVQDP